VAVHRPTATAALRHSKQFELCGTASGETASQLLEKFPAPCATQTFIILFTLVPLPRQIKPSCPTSFGSNVMFSRRRFGVPCVIFPLSFPIKTLYDVSQLFVMPEAFPRPFFLNFNILAGFLDGIKITKLLIMQFCSFRFTSFPSSPTIFLRTLL
jgi:hypothetical protein